MAKVGTRTVTAAGSLVLKPGEDATFDSNDLTFVVRFQDDGGVGRMVPQVREGLAGQFIEITLFNLNASTGTMVGGALQHDGRDHVWSFIVHGFGNPAAHMLTYTVSA